LKDRQLLYYKKTEDGNTEWYGGINLRDCEHIGELDEQITKKPHSFQIVTPDRVYYLCADTEEEKNEWVTVLRFHPGFCANKFVN